MEAVDPELRSILTGLLQKDPAKRSEVSEALEVEGVKSTEICPKES